MAGYRTVLFDLDGTLLDTLADLRDAVNHELEREGDPPRTLEEVRTFVGNGLRMLMARALPAGRSEEEIDRRMASMRAYYAANTCHHTAPYPGILELLAALRRRGTAVAVIGAAGLAVGLCIQGIVSGWMDVCSIYACPIGALLAGVFFYWVWGKEDCLAQVNLARRHPLGPWFYPLAKYVYCGVTVAVLILGAVNGGIG